MKVQVNLKMKLNAEAVPTFDVIVGSAETVSDVKKRVVELQLLPFQDLDLVLGSDVLENGKQLAHYGVKEGTSLDLVVKATEASLVQQLKELVDGKDLSPNEIGALYSYKYGVGINKALKIIGHDGTLQAFLEQQKFALCKDAPVQKAADKFKVNITCVAANAGRFALEQENEIVVNAQDTVLAVKKRTAAVQLIPFPELDLVYGGQALEDSRRLVECGVKGDCSLELVIREAEKNLVQQLEDLLHAQHASPRDLGLLYACKHGVSINDALKIVGHEGKLNAFLEKHTAFHVEGGCVSLAGREPSAVKLPGIPEEVDASSSLNPEVAAALSKILDTISNAAFLNVDHIEKGAVSQGTADAEAEIFVRGLPPMSNQRWLPPLLKAVAGVLSECLADGAVSVVSGSVQVYLPGPVTVQLRFSPALEACAKLSCN